MQILDCEQGSEEWLQLRRGIATASNFSKIVTTKGVISTQLRDYAFQLASETITDLQDESYKSADMQRGNDLEPDARNAYQQHTLSLVKEVGFMSLSVNGVIL